MRIRSNQQIVSTQNVHVSRRKNYLCATWNPVVGTRDINPRLQSSSSEECSNGEEIEPTSTALFAQQRSTGLGQGQGRPLVIKPKPASRRAGEPPKPVEIERTSSFLISKRNQQEAGSNPSVGEKVHANPSTPGGISPEHDGEDPMSWVLRKTDQSLDAVEDNVPDVAKSAITFVTGNLGTTTSKVAVDAAKLAAKGGAKLFEVALPAGKWALSKGFGVVVSVAMKQQGKKNRRPQGKDDNANGTR